MTSSNIVGASPGPWEVDIETNRDACVYVNYPGGDLLGSVAVCYAGKYGSIEKAHANARLIAAAPELLDALVAAKDFICQTDKYKTGHTGAADVVNAAVLVIAKATL